MKYVVLLASAFLANLRKNATAGKECLLLKVLLKKRKASVIYENFLTQEQALPVKSNASAKVPENSY